MDRIGRELSQFRHELDEKFAEVEQRLHGVEAAVSSVKGVMNNMLDKLEAEFRFI